MERLRHLLVTSPSGLPKLRQHVPIVTGELRASAFADVGDEGELSPGMLASDSAAAQSLRNVVGRRPAAARAALAELGSQALQAFTTEVLPPLLGIIGKDVDPEEAADAARELGQAGLDVFNTLLEWGLDLGTADQVGDTFLRRFGYPERVQDTVYSNVVRFDGQSVKVGFDAEYADEVKFRDKAKYGADCREAIRRYKDSGAITQLLQLAVQWAAAVQRQRMGMAAMMLPESWQRALGSAQSLGYNGIPLGKDTSLSPPGLRN